MSNPSLHPILAQHFESSEIAFAEIDKEIAAMQERIRQLRAFRNSFTPIHRLPPEILARIFSFVQLSSALVQSIYTPYYGNGPSLEWVAVTCVSQRWRNVALGSPDLWSHISSSYPKPIVEEWLQRSKAAPLSISLHERSFTSSDTQFTGASLFRIRELELDLSADSWEALLPNLTFPAPVLESLSISISTTSYSHSSTNSDNIFVGMAPCLWRLDLRHCPLNIHSSLTTNLTSLEIHDPPQRFSSTDLLNTLRRLPRLTSLTLVHVLLEDAIPVSSDFDIVALSSLESLSIRGRSFKQDLNILSHLSIPADSTLHFHSDTRAAEAVIIPALLEFLRINKAARQPSSSHVFVDRIDLQCTWHKLTLDMTSESYGVHLVKLVLLASLRSSLEFPDTPETTELFSYLPLAALRSFHTDCALDTGIWASVLGRLPELKHISATGDPAINLLSAIAEDALSYDETSQTTNKANGREKEEEEGRSHGAGGSDSRDQSVAWDPIFTKLEILEFHDVNFFDRPEDFVAALRARKMADKGIKNIRFMGCGGRRKILDTFEGVVDVVWDEHGCDSEDGGADYGPYDGFDTFDNNYYDSGSDGYGY
ncbi:hypothetical protein BDN72DRAFT_195999 [Pluteus cervinus]|uniref:Uncharacterized protein n=1 Tax=Pluteus cervinus TaxID=181527 RepID=A0ACD3AIK2_9AGAR|nr:hypothetical protein BDN72DRAFT_195999 [Pluteus cervinus]